VTGIAVLTGLAALFSGTIAYLSASSAEATPVAEKKGPAALLFARAEQHLAEGEKLAEELAVAAQDESLSGSDRARAVMLLSKLGTERGRKFMLNNLSMRVQLPGGGTEEQRAPMHPCRFYLTSHEHRDWNTARTMLGMLDEDIPQARLTWFPYVLRELFRSHGAAVMPRAMLEYELKRNPNEPRKRQLSYILGQLGQ
jgi:hypothetical protein